MDLQTAAMGWPTPHGMAGVDHMGKQGAGGEFAKMAEAWPTPNAADHKTSPDYPHKGGNPTLPMAAVTWPTPGANDHKGSAQEGQRRGQLDEATEHWPTPAGSMTAGEDLRATWTPGDKPIREDGKVLQTALTTCTQIWGRSPLAPEPASNGPASSPNAQNSRPRLNPAFVEWLMGLGHHGWTDFAPLGTAWYRYKRRMRSCLFGLVCGRNH